MKAPRSKLRGIKRKIPLNLLAASFGESHPKRFKRSVTKTQQRWYYPKNVNGYNRECCILIPPVVVPLRALPYLHGFSCLHAVMRQT